MPSLPELEEALINAVAEVDEDRALDLAAEMLDRDVEPLLIVEACRAGLEIVGKRYERREYFLSALIMSGEIFNGIMARLEYRGFFRLAEDEDAPKVLLGAPLGDVHDLGKYIVSMLLRSSGFKVIDLGVSVAPSRFLEAAREHHAGLVGMSALITAAYESVRETVAGFEQAGLRDRVKIMLGGGATNQRVCTYTGADAWSRDAADAVKFAKEFLGKPQ
jgi:methylmalonyl-CoA mutase cobalamin-binding domain/chain